MLLALPRRCNSIFFARIELLSFAFFMAPISYGVHLANIAAAVYILQVQWKTRSVIQLAAAIGRNLAGSVTQRAGSEIT